MTPGIQSLEELLLARDELRRRLDALVSEQKLGDAATLEDDRFLFAFSSVGRRLGKAPLSPTADEVERLRARGIDWSLENWGTDELGRVLLLGRAFASLAPERALSLLDGCYARGDNRERQAVLRGLPFLPERGRFLTLAVDACRVNVLPVFEAIACENPFPADEFPDLNMNQMVMKAMFNGVALSRIIGLDRRKGAELARMATDFAAERRAAGRSVPADIDRVLRPQVSAGGNQ